MRKFLFSIIGALSIYSAFAAGENIPTSKSYVDAAIATKQDIISATTGASQVLTNTGTAGEYGTKEIYDSNATYGEQTDALIDAITMNTAVQNAIDSEFQCVEYDENNECLLMQLGGITQVPTGYTQLQYLESTGTQWIDTGIAPTNTTGVRVEFNKKATGDQVVVGILGSSSENLYVNPATTNLYIPFAQSYGQATYGPYAYNTDYTVSINYKNDRKRYVNGVSFQNITTTLTSTGKPLYMFAGDRLTSDSANWFFKGRIYYLQITEGTELVRNFIPARRNSDGVLGMYDTVTNAFFINNGTGEFIAGPIVYIPQSN